MLAIKAGQLIDGNGAKPIKDAVLLIENGSLGPLGPSAEVSIPEGAEVIDASARTVMPGMFDVHCHPAIFTIDYQRRLFTHPTTWIFKTALMLKKMLHAGFTTVRRLGMR